MVQGVRRLLVAMTLLHPPGGFSCLAFPKQGPGGGLYHPTHQ